MEQPFYIGQKVVAITNHSQGDYKIGDEKTVKNITFFCCRWVIDVGNRFSLLEYKNWSCTCGYKRHDGVAWYSHYNFAPLQEGFQAITFERVMEDEKVSVN